MELGPFWGGDLGTSWSTKHSFLIGDRQLPETPVSASSHLVSLPSWSLGPQFPYSSNGLSFFAFSFTIPFSLSWNTLLLCLSSHLCLVLPREWASGSYSITPLSLWFHVPLAGNGSPSRVTSSGGRGMPRTVQTVVQQALRDWRFMSVPEVQIPYHVVAGNVIVPIVSPLFSCHWEKSCWEQAKVEAFYILV